jgi:HD-GYP domain-containing protein (c-di-GMP phosphodiesterase class II)
VGTTTELIECLSDSESNNDMGLKNNYVPIQLMDLRANSRIEFDLYIQLSDESKYILYKKASQNIETAMLDRFHRHEFSNFFVLENEYSKYLLYIEKSLIDSIGQMDPQNNIPATRRSAKDFLSATFANGQSKHTPRLIENLNTVVVTFVDMFIDSESIQKNVYKKFIEISSKGSGVQRHPLNVCTYAILIMMGLGYSMRKDIISMAMASLLHDLGLTRLPSSMMLVKHDSLEGMSTVISEAIKTHPYKTLEIIKETKIKLSAMTENLILQHHERADGKGYPRRLVGSMIDDLSQVLRFADLLDEEVIRLQHEQKNIADGIQEFLDNMKNDKSIKAKLLTQILELFVR